MQTVIIVIHLMIVAALIGVVLLQRSEGGGLGIGSGGGLGGLATPQGTANFLTRATAICAGLFFCTSLLLGILAGAHSRSNQSILDALQDEKPAVTDTQNEAPVQTPVETSKEAPSVPVAE